MLVWGGFKNFFSLQMFSCLEFLSATPNIDDVPEEELLKEGEPRILTIFIFFITHSYTMPALRNFVINVDALSSDYL